jgi:MFS family permease
MERLRSPFPLIATLCVAEVLGMAGFAAFPALLPGFFAEWGLSNTDAGWINGIFFAGYLVSVPVLLALTDRVDPRRIYLLCMVVSGVSNLGFAMMAEGFWTALGLRCLAGVGLAGTYMPGLKILGDRLEGAVQSRAVAYYTASFGIGAGLSLYFSGKLDAVFGWQTTFALAAVGPLAVLPLMALVGKTPATDAPRTRLLDFRPVLHCRPAMAYVVAYAVHNWELFAFRSWLVVFLVFAAERNPGASAWDPILVAALVNLVATPSSIIGNELAGRFGRRRILYWVMGASGAMACVFGFASALPYGVLVFAVFFYGALIGADSASITAGAVANAPPGYRGATMGVHACIGFMGSFAGPLAMGVILDVAGGGGSVLSWGLAFASSAVVVVLGPVALMILGKNR